MTTHEFVEKLQIVADMGDKQIETLANLLIDYFADKDKNEMGFIRKDEDEPDNEDNSNSRRR